MFLNVFGFAAGEQPAAQNEREAEEEFNFHLSPTIQKISIFKIQLTDNPNGIASFSPGLAAQSTTLGQPFKTFSTPSGLNRPANKFAKFAERRRAVGLTRKKICDMQNGNDDAHAR